MTKTRLEAFSDGVIAIIITIMVLELKPPHSADVAVLKPMLPVFISYILSFIHIGIYWNNHHHLMTLVKHVNGPVLWANLHLLFWLSLIPFTTAWMGENFFAPWPVAMYGVVLLFAGMAYYLLSALLIHYHGHDSLLCRAMGRDVKGMISVVIYAVAIPICMYCAWVAFAMYVVVALMWLVPDRRVENALAGKAPNREC